MTRLILYNIEYFEGCDGKKMSYLFPWRRFFKSKKIECEICNGLKEFNPDIVSLVEIEKGSFVEKNPLEFIMKELNLNYFIEKVKYEFKGLFRILEFIPYMNDHSNAIISNKKIVKSNTVYFKEGFKRTVIDAVVQLPPNITLLLVHLALSKKTRSKQIRELISIVNSMDGPVILMGDFNTFDGKKEVEIILEKTKLKYKDKNTGEGVFTYPAYHPRRRFDYIFTSPEIKIKDYRILRITGSDHLPVLMDFIVR